MRYSRKKIACEDLLVAAYRTDGFPATIVRPSHTYDRTTVPFDGGWTVLGRMRQGKEIVVPATARRCRESRVSAAGPGSGVRTTACAPR